MNSFGSGIGTRLCSVIRCNLSILATVLIIGIGGNYAFGGYVPVFSYNIPCIAFASIFGIILNIILMKREKNDSNLT